jgi:sensor domain CHASE-containing protein
MIEQTRIAPNTTAPNRMRNAIAAAIALLILIVAAALASRLYEQRVNEQTRELVSHDLAHNKDTLSAVMQARFAVLESISAFGNARDASSELATEWDGFARLLIERAHGVQAISLVKDNQQLVYTASDNRELLLQLIATETTRLTGCQISKPARLC